MNSMFCLGLSPRWVASILSSSLPQQLWRYTEKLKIFHDSNPGPRSSKEASRYWWPRSIRSNASMHYLLLQPGTYLIMQEFSLERREFSHRVCPGHHSSLLWFILWVGLWDGFGPLKTCSPPGTPALLLVTQMRMFVLSFVAGFTWWGKEWSCL